jgi:hypothetical protein
VVGIRPGSQLSILSFRTGIRIDGGERFPVRGRAGVERLLAGIRAYEKDPL